MGFAANANHVNYFTPSSLYFLELSNRGKNVRCVRLFNDTLAEESWRAGVLNHKAIGRLVPNRTNGAPKLFELTTKRHKHKWTGEFVVLPL